MRQEYIVIVCDLSGYTIRILCLLERGYSDAELPVMLTVHEPAEWCRNQTNIPQPGRDRRVRCVCTNAMFGGAADYIGDGEGVTGADVAGDDADDRRGGAGFPTALA